jgi:O-antigen/teichoic acid export membrane protein
VPPSGRASNASVSHRGFASLRAARLSGPWPDKRTIIGPFARKVMSLSALTAAGQATFVIALPALSRLYAPADFGIFTVYLSIVNIGGPIVGLKFESALYADRTREDAAATLSLSFLTILITSSAVTIALFFFGGILATPFGPAARILVRMLPIGLLLAGMGSLSSAWAIKSEAVSTLGAARFAQPALMTALQLAAGVIHPFGGVALIGAHLFSHLAYTTFILGKTLTRRDLRTLRLARWNGVLRHAKVQRHFPLFLLPAQVSYLAVSNLPPLLLSSFYGAEVAGQCGVAYRIVTAPLAIASLPLGAIFTGVVSRTPDLSLVVRLARKVFLANLLLVSIPILLFGAAAPAIAPAALGDRWMITGWIIAAFALIGAAQSLAAPFTEITSIFRSQALRFAIESVSATVVVTAIVAGGMNRWSALQTIWVMSSAGALSSFLGVMLIWWRLRAMMGRRAAHRATTIASVRRG